MKLVLATKNAGKLKELKELGANCDWLDLALAPESFHPEETGNTFIENAIIKAQAAAELTGELTLADDSGLAVEALDEAPGIHSARYCEGSDQDRRSKILREMHDIPERSRKATFLCAMALCSPKGEILHTTIGRWEGTIGKQERGRNGFGYDPIFYLTDINKSAAELSSEEKTSDLTEVKLGRKCFTF